METRLTLRPGQPGTRKRSVRFGGRGTSSGSRRGAWRKGLGLRGGWWLCRGEVCRSMILDVDTYRHKHVAMIGNIFPDLDASADGGMPFNH